MCRTADAGVLRRPRGTPRVGTRYETLGDRDPNKDLDHNPPRAKNRCNAPLDIARKLNKFSE
jgi:hypothetical protein